MRIGVTGGEGFIGGHLIEYLISQGNQVAVLGNNRRHLTNLTQGVEFQNGDIRSISDIRRTFNGCQVIVNLAAESSVMRCESDPTYARITNVGGVRNLAYFALQQGVKLVQASSREVYGEQQTLPVPEETPFGAKNIYGRSKAAAERLLANCPIDKAILRFSNVTGTRDEGRLLPLWLKAASEGKPLTVYGGQQLIDFVPVEVIVRAIDFAIHHHVPYPVNIGSGTATPILELAERIQQYVPGTKIKLLPPRVAEVKGFQADISKMVCLGIQPPADPLGNLPELAQYYASVVQEVA